MCVCVHLSPFVVTSGPKLHERTPTDLRPFNSVAARPRECLNVELGPRAPVLVLFCIPSVTGQSTAGLCTSVPGCRIQSSCWSRSRWKRTFLTNGRYHWTAGRCLGWINQGFTVTGSQLSCGYNYYWQQQPELTAWSWPLTSSPFGVATPVNYCTPRRAMNVPILISLYFSFIFPTLY